MRRAATGVIMGIVAWFFAATLLNFILRAAIAGYAEAEPSMTFTLPMMIGRLLVGVGASLAAGAACAAIARSSLRPAQVVAGAMVLVFIPVHGMLWEKFPAWYHLTFLVSLAPAVLAGATLARLRRAR